MAEFQEFPDTAAQDVEQVTASDGVFGPDDQGDGNGAPNAVNILVVNRIHEKASLGDIHKLCRSWRVVLCFRDSDGRANVEFATREECLAAADELRTASCHGEGVEVELLMPRSEPL